MEKYSIFRDFKSFNYDDCMGKTITLVGLESVGSILVDSLVRAGLNVRLIDRGRVEVTEIASQALFLEEDVNRFKAKQGKKRLEMVNKDVKIKAFHEELTQDTDYLLDSDLVVDCTNNKYTSEVVAQYCLSEKIPVIYVNNVVGGCDIIVRNDDSDKSNVAIVDSQKIILPNHAHRASGLVLELILCIFSKVPVKDKYGVRNLS